MRLPQSRGGFADGSSAFVGTKIAVVGPGAIGATVAALLHAAGRRVLLCGHTARESIEVRPDDREPIVVPGPVHTDPTEVEGPVGVVLLAVKDTRNEAAQSLAELLRSEGLWSD
jgi:2-dehydropantoate 2-reductase